MTSEELKKYNTSPQGVHKLMEDIYRKGGLNALFRDLPEAVYSMAVTEGLQAIEDTEAELEARFQERLLLESPYPQKGVLYVN
jgi:hypothetical protein